MKTFTSISELKETFPTWGDEDRVKITFSCTHITEHLLRVIQEGNTWVFENNDKIPESTFNINNPFQAELQDFVRWEHGCKVCGKTEDVSERFSRGMPTGVYCDEDWKKTSYSKEGFEGCDFLDVWEYLGDDD